MDIEALLREIFVLLNKEYSEVIASIKRCNLQNEQWVLDEMDKLNKLSVEL